MSDVVDLHPARSVEFEGELQVLADRFSVALYEVLALIEAIGPDGEPHFSRLLRIKSRIVHAMDAIQDHVYCIEQDMDMLFADLNDGDIVYFQTYDIRSNALISSELSIRCHSVRVQHISSFTLIDTQMHHNDDERDIIKLSSVGGAI